MTDCLFCKIAAKEIPANIVYEDANWLAFLDIKPINLGHTLLIPKEHHENLFDLPESLLAEAGGLIQKIGKAIKDGTGADGFNLGMNNGAAAGQLVPHAHFHLIPRFANDGREHWNGKENISKEELEATASKLRSLATSR